MPKEVVVTNQVDRQYLLKKQQKRKQERKERQIVWILRLLFACLLTAYLMSDYSTVKQIAVFGNTAIQRDAIVKQSALTFSTRYYLFIPYLAEKQILKNPLVESVVVKRTGNQIVKITVQEKRIVGFLQTVQGMEWLLGDGTTLPVDDTTMDYMTQVPFLEGFDERMDLLPKLARYLLDVTPETLAYISDVVLYALEYDPEQLKLHMIDRNQVYVSLANLANVNNYALLLPAIPQSGVCIFFDGFETKAYMAECLE